MHFILNSNKLIYKQKLFLRRYILKYKIFSVYITVTYQTSGKCSDNSVHFLSQKGKYAFADTVAVIPFVLNLLYLIFFMCMIIQYNVFHLY